MANEYHHLTPRAELDTAPNQKFLDEINANNHPKAIIVLRDYVENFTSIYDDSFEILKNKGLDALVNHLGSSGLLELPEKSVVNLKLFNQMIQVSAILQLAIGYVDVNNSNDKISNTSSRHQYLMYKQFGNASLSAIIKESLSNREPIKLDTELDISRFFHPAVKALISDYQLKQVVNEEAPYQSESLIPIKRARI